MVLWTLAQQRQETKEQRTPQKNFQNKKYFDINNSAADSNKK
jgi:hypothetical protein